MMRYGQRSCGQKAVQAAWRRIWNGFVAFENIGGSLMSFQSGPMFRVFDDDEIGPFGRCGPRRGSRTG